MGTSYKTKGLDVWKQQRYRNPGCAKIVGVGAAYFLDLSAASFEDRPLKIARSLCFNFIFSAFFHFIQGFILWVLGVAKVSSLTVQRKFCLTKLIGNKIVGKTRLRYMKECLKLRHSLGELVRCFKKATALAYLICLPQEIIVIVHSTNALHKNNLAKNCHKNCVFYSCSNISTKLKAQKTNSNRRLILNLGPANT